MPRIRPRKPPVSDMTRLSVSNCRMMCPGLRQSGAGRSSRFLAVARISRRFATLAHAMSRTKVTAPSRTRRKCACLDHHILKRGNPETTLWTESAGIRFGGTDRQRASVAR